MVVHDVSEITGKIVKLLKPISSEDRKRVVSASLILLGEDDCKVGNDGKPSHEEEKHHNNTFPTPANRWMNQYDISLDHIRDIFHLEDGTGEVITKTIPGKTKTDKTINAYILTGILAILQSGEPKFKDQDARLLCTKAGFYTSKGHTNCLKNMGNKFTGTKDKGWTLTIPGLEAGAKLVKDLNS